MNLLAKPENRWGWARVGALGLCAAVLAWTALAALLRGLGAVPWMAWSGYADFSLVRGLELATAALVAAVGARWMEEQDLREASEHSNRRDARQRAIIRRTLDAQTAEAVRAALPELNGKGKGELLRLLYEEGLLNAADGRVNLRGVDLSRAVLRHAVLRGAALAGCDLSGARLDGANLEGADLTDARLDGTFLGQANLKGARLNGALEDAVLIETTLPDGSKRTNEKGRDYLRSQEIAVLVDRL